MSTEAERTYKRTEYIQENTDNSYSSKYDFEIKICKWKKILITFLNLLTGGLGTLIEPFITEKPAKKRLIFAGFVLAFFQILHFLHGFSLLTKVLFLEDIYNKISDDSMFEAIFGNEETHNSDKNGEESENFELVDYFTNDSKLNVANLIAKKSRVKFLKECFGIISGMSYYNSIFTMLLDFMDDENNKILSYKVVLYSIFNPGGGIILASFALIPSINCCNGNYNIKGIVICIISIIIGLIVITNQFNLRAFFNKNYR